MPSNNCFSVTMVFSSCIPSSITYMPSAFAAFMRPVKTCRNRNTVWRLEYIRIVDKELMHNLVSRSCISIQKCSKNWLILTPMPVRSTGLDAILMLSVSGAPNPRVRVTQSTIPIRSIGTSRL
ncbi:MAG: hypothetical protein C5617_006070 [ANME-2 cluster archaeon]|nr:MAG: hypothetical protein C5617_006070 [ANME-2 cluster archaeon]